jgi:hypothetical protein
MQLEARCDHSRFLRSDRQGKLVKSFAGEIDVKALEAIVGRSAVVGQVTDLPAPAESRRQPEGRPTRTRMAILAGHRPAPQRYHGCQ